MSEKTDSLSDPLADPLSEPLIVAIAKGRLFDAIRDLLSGTDWVDPDAEFADRALVIDLSSQLRILVARAKDVPVYVARGAAHAGICGLDTILESGDSLIELCDLGLGRCDLVLAGPGEVQPERIHSLATKFPRLTRQVLDPLGLAPELVVLGGALEMAPLVGLADGIVDLVETGQTLRDNGLQVWQKLMPVSTRLFTRESALVTHNRQLSGLANALESAVAGKGD